MMLEKFWRKLRQAKIIVIRNDIWKAFSIPDFIKANKILENLNIVETINVLPIIFWHAGFLILRAQDMQRWAVNLLVKIAKENPSEARYVICQLRDIMYKRKIGYWDIGLQDDIQRAISSLRESSRK